MKERSLVLFTLLSQAAVGTFLTLEVLNLRSAQGLTSGSMKIAVPPGLPLISFMMGLAIISSLFHLGSPQNAWRALSNLHRSWLSREIFFAMLFSVALIALSWMQWIGIWDLDVPWWSIIVTALLGLGLILSMASAYRLRTIPAWDNWASLMSFFLTTLLMGATFSGFLLLFSSHMITLEIQKTLQALILWVILLAGLELADLAFWLAKLKRTLAATSIGKRSRIRQAAAIRYRWTFALASIVAASLALISKDQAILLSQGGWMILASGLIVTSEVFGRLIFYASRVRLGV